ncbi:Uncharacterized protein BM_BM14278, partial [Brugia malayi]
GGKILHCLCLIHQTFFVIMFNQHLERLNISFLADFSQPNGKL